MRNGFVITVLGARSRRSSSCIIRIRGPPTVSNLMLCLGDEALDGYPQRARQNQLARIEGPICLNGQIQRSNDKWPSQTVGNPISRRNTNIPSGGFYKSR